MKKEHRLVKELLEAWGAYKRRSLSALGYPKSSPAFDPENYECVYGSAPNWKRKHIMPEDEKKFRQMRQKSSKPTMKSRIPNYMPSHRMNRVDIMVNDLPKIYKEVAEKKFIEQMKDREIAKTLDKHVKTIERRTEEIYSRLAEKLFEKKKLNKSVNFAYLCSPC